MRIHEQIVEDSRQLAAEEIIVQEELGEHARVQARAEKVKLLRSLRPKDGKTIRGFVFETRISAVSSPIWTWDGSNDTSTCPVALQNTLHRHKSLETRLTHSQNTNGILNRSYWTSRDASSPSNELWLRSTRLKFTDDSGIKGTEPANPFQPARERERERERD